MNIENTEAKIEAILFAGGESVPAVRICEVLELDEPTLQRLVEHLNERLLKSGSALEAIKLDDAYQLTTRREYAEPVRKALEIRRNTPLSQAAFEVLSVIAYNQPVTRSYVEQVRGVDCSGVVSSLCAKGLIEEHGRLDLPGRPLLYVTTPNFLRCFGLSSLDELEPVPELGEDEEKNEDKPEGIKDSAFGNDEAEGTF